MYIHKQILSQELIFGISYLFIYLFVCFVQFREFIYFERCAMVIIFLSLARVISTFYAISCHFP